MVTRLNFQSFHCGARCRIHSVDLPNCADSHQLISTGGSNTCSDPQQKNSMMEKHDLTVKFGLEEDALWQNNDEWVSENSRVPHLSFLIRLGPCYLNLRGDAVKAREPRQRRQSHSQLLFYFAQLALQLQFHSEGDQRPEVKRNSRPNGQAQLCDAAQSSHMRVTRPRNSDTILFRSQFRIPRFASGTPPLCFDVIGEGFCMNSSPKVGS